MVGSGFEYRHRFWMIVLVYGVAYAFYNVDHLNVLYSINPWNFDDIQKEMLVRVLYGAATLQAAGGALLLTWALAHRPPIARPGRAAFSISGPFRYVRNPQYISYFLLVLALGTFQSRLGFCVMLLGETILLLRLMAREEILLDQEYGYRFRAYAQRVPRLLPALRPRVAEDGHPPQWRQAIWSQAFLWGLVATLLAFAFTLSDPVGYAFAGATLSFLALQYLVQLLLIRLRRT